MFKQVEALGLCPDIPIASVVVQALAEVRQLDLLTLQVLRDCSLVAEYPGKIERALSNVRERDLLDLAPRSGLFDHQLPRGTTAQAVKEALVTAIERGQESILTGSAYEFQIQKRYWALAATCARQAPAFCRYICGLPWSVAQVLSRNGFGEAAASHMVELMPLTQVLHSGKDFESHRRSWQAWQMAVIALGKDGSHLKAMRELNCALLGGVVPRVPKVSEQAKWLSPTSLDVEFFIAQMFPQLSQTGIAVFLSLLVPLDETENAVQRVMRRYQLKPKKVEPMKLSEAKKRRMPDLVMKLLCRRLQDGFVPEEVVGLLPYAAVHAAWVLEIDPKILGSAVWTDWCVRKLRNELRKLCGV